MPAADIQTPPVNTQTNNSSLQADTSNWNTYKNVQYKFIIKYPKEWVAYQKSGLQNNRVFVSFREADAITQSFSVFLNIDSAPSLLDTAKNVQYLTINGIQAKMATLIDSRGISYFRIGFLKDGYNYEIASNGLNNEEKIIKTMAQTLKFE